MKQRNQITTTVLALLAVIVICAGYGCAGNNKPARAWGNGITGGITDPIPTTVTFGSGKGCVSRGICNSVAVQTGKQGGNDTFSMTAAPQNKLFMYFGQSILSASSLIKGTYTFDAPYSVDNANPVFAVAGFPAGTIIPSGKPFRVTQNATATEDTMWLDTVVTGADTIYATFGTPTSATAPGILNFFPKAQAPKNAVPVVMSFQPGNAAGLVLTFDTTVMRANQPAAMNNFYQPGTNNLVPSYAFADTLTVSSGGFQPLFMNCMAFLPPGAVIMPSGGGIIGANTGKGLSNWITDTVAWGINCPPAINLASKNLTSSGFDLNWANNILYGAVSSYMVFLSQTDRKGPYTQVGGPVTVQQHTAKIAGLAAGIDYFVYVMSVCNPTVMTSSDTIKVTTTVADNQNSNKRSKGDDKKGKKK